MTELMKRYKAETGRKPENLFMGSEESLIHFTRERDIRCPECGRRIEEETGKEKWVKAYSQFR